MPCLIFDFDGTLADTRTGILATAQEVLRRMGLPPADEAALVAALADENIGQRHLEDAIRCNPSSLGRKSTRNPIGFKG